MHTGLALTRIRYSATHANAELQMETHLHLNTKGTKSLSSLVLGDFLLQLMSRSVWIHSEKISKISYSEHIKKHAFQLFPVFYTCH